MVPTVTRISLSVVPLRKLERLTTSHLHENNQIVIAAAFCVQILQARADRLQELLLIPPGLYTVCLDERKLPA